MTQGRGGLLSLPRMALSSTTLLLAHWRLPELNTQPMRALAIAPPPASRLAAYDSGSGWFATPFPYGSFIRSTLPVYWRFPRLASLRGRDSGRARRASAQDKDLA